MREDGDIDKKYFRAHKQIIDAEIQKLTDEIRRLQPTEPARVEADLGMRMKNLRKLLESYVCFDGLIIPDSVVEAFVERIWVSRDDIRWYLRSSASQVSMDDRMKIAEFNINLEQAKAYQYSISTRKRVHKWTDIHVSIWL